MRDFGKVAISLYERMDGPRAQGYADLTMMITMDEKIRFSFLATSPKMIKSSEKMTALAKECLAAHAIVLIVAMVMLYRVAADPASTFLSSSITSSLALVGAFMIHAPAIALFTVGIRKGKLQREIFFTAYQEAGGKLSPNEDYPHTRRDNLWRLIGGMAICSQTLLIFFFERDVFGWFLIVLTHLLINGIYMSWALLTPYFEMQKMSYGEGRSFIARELPGCISLGLSASILCMIPIAQFQYISSVIAGTGKWVAMQEQEQETKTPEQEPVEAPA